MWYIPLFLAYLINFFGNFGRKANSSCLPVSGWILVVVSAAYEWYLVTEGQISVIFTLMLFTMTVVLFWRSEQLLEMNVNAKFLYYRSILTFIFVFLWVVYLWDDEILRQKYPGVWYVPEPWSYASLYIMKK